MVLLGDLNADPSDINGRRLFEFCDLYNFTCHVNEPTRITDTTSTCLDQIISNIPNFISKINVLPPVSTNDHSTVAAQLNFRIHKEAPYYRFVWDYNRADYDGFRQCLSETNWDIIMFYRRWYKHSLYSMDRDTSQYSKAIYSKQDYTDPP